MRRLFILAIVTMVGFIPFGLTSVLAQSWEGSEAWTGVIVEDPIPYNSVSPDVSFLRLAEFLGNPQEPEAGGSSSISTRLDEAYPVHFQNDPADPEHRAFIPEVQGAEFMVVIVESGEFVLDVKGPGSFLVDPVIDLEIQSSADDRIEIMHAAITGTDVHYNPTGQFVLDEKGEECTNLCTVLPGVAVQVTDGDRIIAPAGAICIWCLLNQNVHGGDPNGLLYVFPLLDPDERFSWQQFDDESAAAAAAVATPEANGDATPDQMVEVMTWAFFDPAGNCRSP